MHDPETSALTQCMEILAGLDPEARVRVFQYLNDRFQGGAATVAVGTSVAPAGRPGRKPGRKPGPKPGNKPGPKPGPRAKRPSKRDFEILPDLNLEPVGKPSFKDFFKKVAPKTFPEKHLTTVYYFNNVLGFSDTNLSHIATAYKAIKQKTPKDLYQSLLQGSSSTKYYNTSNINSLAPNSVGETWVKTRWENGAE